MNTIASPSTTRTGSGRRACTAVGCTNSSLSPRWYAASSAATAFVGVKWRVAAREQVVGAFDAVPTLVAIHREVAADDRRDAADAELGEAARRARASDAAALRGGVSRPSRNACTIDARRAARGRVRRSARRCGLRGCARRPATAAEHVQRARPFSAASIARFDHGVGGELAGFDREADPRQILIDDAAGAEVHVADLGVAHLPRRQSDVAGPNPRSTYAARSDHSASHVGVFAAAIALPSVRGAVAESVQHDEQTGATRRVCHERENLF